MRTTIDMPDDLFRRAKSAAALRGQKFKDFVAECLESGLSAPVATRRGHASPLPALIPPSGIPIPSLTNAEIEEILLKDDLDSLSG